MNTQLVDRRHYLIIARKPHLRVLLLAVAALWLVSVAGAVWWAVKAAAPELLETRDERDALAIELTEAKQELAQVKQSISTLKRADQISQAANTELQATLAEREEQIAGLRADVEFYEQLVGATGQRRGLSVHQAQFRSEDAGTWRYTLTLIQNLNRAAISQGQMSFAIEGVKDGKLTTLRWPTLKQQENAEAQPFSFRYFQQLEGSIALPEDFTPQRVRVQLRASGSTVDQTIAWQRSTD